MSEELESIAGKKRRVIHWNPDAGREQASHRWTWKRILAWSVLGFFGVLFAAGAVIRIVRWTVYPAFLKPQAAVVATKTTAADANSEFITQAKAEQAHELAAKAITNIQRMPQGHPSQMQQMIVMLKNFGEGETLLARHDFAQAFSIFDALNKDIDVFAQNVKLEAQVKQSYDAILLRIKDLEPARTLLPGALDTAYDAAGAGRKLLEDGNFVGAKKVFDRGFAELKKAEQALADYVRDNLVVGQKALTKGQKAEAKKAFEAALEKSPGNEDAVRGLKRAENIDRVYALLQQGENLEKQAQYASAADSYQKAFALDGFSAAAQEGAARAARMEKETKFAAAKSAADDAVKHKDWPKAISEYESALKVYPQKTEVVAALKSAKESAHKDAVQKALAKAYNFENQHQWNEARAAYDETLKLQPDQADALDGYKRAGMVIRALLEYDSKIEAAEQLANKAEFQQALRKFNDAMNVKPTYLEASDRVLQLRSLLQQQSQPVEVTFKSDGRTWVSIAGYRQPQFLESMSLKILPGDYEVIGRRKGYRDVQMLLQVRNGTPPPTVTVVCNVSADRL